MTERGGYLEAVKEIREPHLFVARFCIGSDEHFVVFEEHEHAHGRAQRDNNMRRGDSCDRGCRCVCAGDCRSAARPCIRMALDGPPLQVSSAPA
jgi:hypothetical protein